MKVNVLRRLIVAMMTLAILTFVLGAVAEPPKKAHHHHSGHGLVSEKLKTNGTHQIDRKGKHSVSAEVRNGKIASFHVKHDTKGEVAVKKYKSRKKLAILEGSEPPARPAQTDLGAEPAQTDLGTVWIAYAYVDEDGNEEYYWFPAEEILDGDTGAIDYVPLN
jgi:hypothetical protein